MEPLFVSDYFYTDVALRFMIVSFYYLSEAAFAYDFEYFVTVGYVIVLDQDITSLVVVKAVVVTAARAHSFLSVRPDKIDTVVVWYFAPLELS
jgi:hypothetical protein